MPLPPYNTPWLLGNGHLETIWPSLFRRIEPLPYVRETIALPDGDVLELDWLTRGARRLAILSHGLEGNSQRHYVVGMARALHAHGWDVLAWNFRGCGGRINRLPKFTHNGSTDDLHAVIRHALDRSGYPVIVLIGFSMGGNLSLVYLGREHDLVPESVRAAICFSVPCDLAAGAVRLAAAANHLYMKRFLRLMGRKVYQQSQRYPQQFPWDHYHTVKNFHDFDSRYTAPLHGFRSARHYWQECSANAYLAGIRRPSWVINARNDPFLAPSCFPDRAAHDNSLLTLIAPEHGGHCGFPQFNRQGFYWSEEVALMLLERHFPAS
ncbi:MAG: alpha/beta fold hydrolase [Desulfuromonadales bacterium]|jgi:uncharacterized protein